MSKGWAGGSTTAWRRTRRAVLRRDGYRCQLKLDGCTTNANHVHHLDGKALGDDPRRLVAACEHCNLKTGDPTKQDPQPRPRRQW